MIVVCSVGWAIRPCLLDLSTTVVLGLELGRHLLLSRPLRLLKFFPQRVGILVKLTLHVVVGKDWRLLLVLYQMNDRVVMRQNRLVIHDRKLVDF